MRRHRQPRGLGHPADLERARHAAHVHDVGLHDVDGAHGDHGLPVVNSQSCSPPVTSIVSASATCLRLLELPVRAGLLEVADAFGLEQTSHLDGALRRVAGIGVDKLRHAIAKRARNGGNDLFGAARPFVLVAAAFGADAPLEGIEALFVAQLRRGAGPRPSA